MFAISHHAMMKRRGAGAAPSPRAFAGAAQPAPARARRVSASAPAPALAALGLALAALTLLLVVWQRPSAAHLRGEPALLHGVKLLHLCAGTGPCSVAAALCGGGGGGATLRLAAPPPAASASALARADARLAAALARAPSLHTIVLHSLWRGALPLAAAVAAAAPRTRLLAALHGAGAGAGAAVADGDFAEAAADEAMAAPALAAAQRAGWLHGVVAGSPGAMRRAPVLPLTLPLPLRGDGDGDGDEARRWRVGVLLAARAVAADRALVQELCVAAAAGSRLALHLVLATPEAGAAAACGAATLYPHESALRVALPALDAIVLIGRGEGGGAAAWDALAAGVPALLVEAEAAGLVSSLYAGDDTLVDALTLVGLPAAANVQAALLRALANRTQLLERARARLGASRAAFEAEWAAAMIGGGDAHLPSVRPRAQPPPPPPPPAPHVAFLTYELAPVTAGGAGVVIASLAEELLANGSAVTVLAHMPCASAELWRATTELAAPAAARGRLRVVCVADVLGANPGAAGGAGAGTRHLHMRRSREFAAAVQLAYAAAPFDVVEAFDFNGAAYELLRDRRARERATGAGGSCGNGALAAGEPAYLPAAVPILVRAHGTIQLIDRAEAAAGGGGGGGRVDPRDALVYRMEQYSLAAADGVLAQSPAMAAYYARAYRLPARQVLLAPPPMARILAPFAAVRAAPATAGVLPPQPQPPLFLVLGKLQRVKGTETVAAALALLHARRPEAAFRAEFIGGDAHCTVHQQRTSACVAAALPLDLRPRIALVGEKPRGALPALLADAVARGAVAAVAASSFETFCMAAHEAAAAGLPLIAADIPALSDAALAPLAVARFRAGNASDLAWQLERALDAHAAAAATAAARAAPPPAYDQHSGPIDVYVRARARVADAEELLLADQAVGAACDAAAATAGGL